MSRAYSEHAAFHHYRLDVIAAWPESESKRAALAAARAALERELAFEHATPAGSHSMVPTRAAWSNTPVSRSIAH